MVASADKPGRRAPAGGPQRTQATIKRLRMYRTKAKRAPDGTVLQEAFHNHSAPLDGRVTPSRNWFGSTRVVGQAELARMREVVDSEARGPNTFLVRGKRLPDALLRAEPAPTVRVQEIEPFDQVFGPRAQRRRSRLPALDPSEVSRAAREEVSAYAPGLDLDTAEQRDLRATSYRSEYDPKLVRGQTARIYGEIYKVIDSSDVVVYVLDARDPAGTRSPHFERYMRLPENEHKHVVLLLNKCDLVPTWATSAWIGVLSRDYPTLAFRASLENPFGKGELLSVLRQFAQLHQGKPQISVGLCGYPNVGKSSIINTLTGRPSCQTAPIPGETKVWQYVALTRRIFLVDAPGVVWADAPRLEAPRVGGPEEGYHYADDDVNLVLRGVLRPEYIDHPEKFVPAILGRVRPEHLNRTYGLRPALSPEDAWAGPEELLKAVARRQGRLLRGGEPDARSAARMLIEDFVRGRLPHFLAPHSPAEAEAHRAGLAEERRRWGGRSDAELISFQNTQDLRALDTRAPDPEAAFRDAFLPDAPVPEPRPDAAPRRARLTSIAEQFEADAASESGTEDLESSEDGPPRPRGPTRASEIDLGPGFVVPKERKRPARPAGPRHRDRDLTRALRSGVVDQADVDRVSRPVAKRAQTRDRGGAAGGKTGEQFYDQAKAKKGIIARTVKKRLA